MKRTSSTMSVSAPPLKQRKQNPRRRQMRPLGRTNLTEVKSFDCFVTGGNLPTSAAMAGSEPVAAFTGITEVNCIQQGATVANRIGNKVVCKSIHFKGTLSANPANLSVARVMLVYDKQPNGAFPAWADLILDQPGAVSGVYSSLNIANKSRFQVLRDQFFNFDAAQSVIHTLNWYVKGRWESEYGATAGAITDFRTGALYLVALYTSAVVALSNCSCRIRYYD